jgi:sodium/bile acid cotransporter 7
VPIANALMPGSSVGLILLPLMLYYPLQFVICAWLAQRYASVTLRRTELLTVAPSDRAVEGVRPRAGL